MIVNNTIQVWIIYCYNIEHLWSDHIDFKTSARITKADSYVEVRFSSLVFSLLSRLFIILAVACRLSLAPITPRAQRQSGPRSCPCHHSLHEGIQSTPPMPHTIHKLALLSFIAIFLFFHYIHYTIAIYLKIIFVTLQSQFLHSARNVSATVAAINLWLIDNNPLGRELISTDNSDVF